MNLARPTPSATIFAVLVLIDIALPGVIGSSVAAPLGGSLLFAFLGLVTVIGVIATQHGTRPAYLAALTTQIVSALLAFGAYIACVRYWIYAIETFVIVATVVALVRLRPRSHPRLV
jgi:hypothetical protein